jgi:protein ImuB
VDLLAHRLGTARIHRMQLVETHTPEKRFESIRAASVSERSSMNARSLADARGSDDRPSLLLDRAEPIRVVAMAPQGPVVSLSHGGQTLRIITSIGPERIAPRWWLTGADDHTAPARDYFKLQDERGRWWWVYRKVGASKWFVQGMWA